MFAGITFVENNAHLRLLLAPISHAYVYMCCTGAVRELRKDAVFMATERDRERTQVSCMGQACRACRDKASDVDAAEHLAVTHAPASICLSLNPFGRVPKHRWLVSKV